MRVMLCSGGSSVWWIYIGASGMICTLVGCVFGQVPSRISSCHGSACDAFVGGQPFNIYHTTQISAA